MVSETKKPEKGDYIIYKNDAGNITHAGIFDTKEIIISKWSAGPVFKHNVWHVNPTYGTNLFYYLRVLPNIISDELKSSRL